ncbi:MAG: hypothetical protein ACTSRP_05315 [Candidatus Helarchaeota archaeon]
MKKIILRILIYTPIIIYTNYLEIAIAAELSERLIRYICNRKKEKKETKCEINYCPI